MSLARPYGDLENKIGYKFKDSNLLLEALTHSSFVGECKSGTRNHYERIEFLGDAVLELVSSKYLYQLQPPMKEGVMTKTRASLVCEQALFDVAVSLELGDFLFLGKGEEKTGGRTKPSILADVIEAIIGAIFLDSGYDEASAFIHRFVLSNIKERDLFTDYKSRLQIVLQSHGTNASYSTVQTDVTSGATRFESSVCVDGKIIGSGVGSNKKSAEQDAAKAALEVLDSATVFENK